MLTEEIKSDHSSLAQAQPASAFEGIYESFLEQEKLARQFALEEEHREHLLINNWWAN